MDRWREIVLSGSWLYDGSVPVAAYIVRQNFDPEHEPDYDTDPPVLNEKGETYSLAFGELREWGAFQSERAPFLTIEAAVSEAEKRYGPIAWSLVDPPRRI